MPSILTHLSGLKTFVEQHPLLWDRAWRLMHASDVFLPHDPTYYALKHLAQSGSGPILDIGANQGISALSFRKICPHHKIISFEPNTAHEVNLRQVQKRLGNYEFHMIGLSDQPGEFTLYTPQYCGIPLHTFSSLDEASVRHAVDITYRPKVRAKIEIVPRQCVIRMLDEFNLTPEVIKIDAEGLESKIFLGGQKTLSAHMPALIFEACHGTLGEITHILSEIGYEILSYVSEADVFSPFDPNGGVAYISGLRNLIAVSTEQRKTLPLRKSLCD